MLQLGRCAHTAFQTRRMQSCCYLAPKKKLIYNKFIWHFIHSSIILGNWYYFLFTIPRKVVFKDYAYFLGTANLRNNSLMVRTLSITCMIPCQRLIVPSSIIIGVVLGRSLGKKASMNLFTKPERWKIKYLLISKVAWRGLPYSLPE